MTDKKPTCYRTFVVGRWNESEHIVEYLQDHNYWTNCVSSATKKNWNSEWNGGALKNIRQQSHCPIFICKVFVRERRHYRGGIRMAKVTLTKHNHWHHMEAMMKI